jgi:hypothetical protein
MKENAKENGNEIEKKENGKQDRNGPEGLQDQGNKKDFEEILKEIRERTFAPHGYPKDWGIWISYFRGPKGGSYIMLGKRIRQVIRFSILAAIVFGVIIVLF